jgi:hypothetical protein
MTSGDYSSGLGVVDQVPIGVSRVAYQNALKGSVCHLAALISGNVDIGWAPEDSQVAQVRCVSICQCHWNAVDSTVVDSVVQVTCRQHGELPVVER